MKQHYLHISTFYLFRSVPRRWLKYRQGLQNRFSQRPETANATVSNLIPNQVVEKVAQTILEENPNSHVEHELYWRNLDLAGLHFLNTIRIDINIDDICQISDQLPHDTPHVFKCPTNVWTSWTAMPLQQQQNSENRWTLHQRTNLSRYHGLMESRIISYILNKDTYHIRGYIYIVQRPVEHERQIGLIWKVDTLANSGKFDTIPNWRRCTWQGWTSENTYLDR